MGLDAHGHGSSRDHRDGPRAGGLSAERARSGRGLGHLPGPDPGGEDAGPPRVRRQRGVALAIPHPRLPEGAPPSLGRRGVPMKITPLATDSFGAGSMATIVGTPDVTVFIYQSLQLVPLVSVTA